MSMFTRNKGVERIENWDLEHIFYNPLLFNRFTEKPFILTRHFDGKGIYTLGRLFDENGKKRLNLPHDRASVNLYQKLLMKITPRRHELELTDGTCLNFEQLTQKVLYEEALFKTCFDHPYQTKWLTRLDNSIPWDEVWESIHGNCLISNRIKSTIWQQVHLNFYTQFSYNKWHNSRDPCPLCKELPMSIYHTLLDCKPAMKAWNDLEVTLYKIHEVAVTDEEKALGIFGRKLGQGVVLRNWLTFILRQSISDTERECYFSSCDSLQTIKKNFRKLLQDELFHASHRCANQNKQDFFDEVSTYKSVVCDRTDGGLCKIKDHLFLSGTPGTA